MPLALVEPTVHQGQKLLGAVVGVQDDPRPVRGRESVDMVGPASESMTDARCDSSPIALPATNAPRLLDNWMKTGELSLATVSITAFIEVPMAEARRSPDSPTSDRYGGPDG